MNLSTYSTDDLYAIRDGCDEIENIYAGFKYCGLCWFLTQFGGNESVAYMLVREFIEDEEYERRTAQGWNERTILAGFIAAMIDDELIMRGK